MYEKILLPIDLHDSSSWEDAIPVAVRQCEANDAALHILYVMSKVHPSVAAFMADDIDEETRQQEAERQLAEFASKIGDQGAEVTYQVASGDSIYDEVLKCRERIGADLIVMTAHRPDLSDYLIGPNAARIVRHAPCSVFVVRK